MADPNMTQNSSNTANQTMQREQAKAEVGGAGSSDRQREQGGMDKSRDEKSGETRSQTGEPGRARNELDQDKSRKETAGQF